MAGGQTDAETEVKGEEQATNPDVIHCVYRFHKCIRSRVRNQILFFFFLTLSWMQADLWRSKGLQASITLHNMYGGVKYEDKHTVSVNETPRHLQSIGKAMYTQSGTYDKRTVILH